MARETLALVRPNAAGCPVVFHYVSRCRLVPECHLDPFDFTCRYERRNCRELLPLKINYTSHVDENMLVIKKNNHRETA